MLYGGGSVGARVGAYQYDPKTDKLTDYGAPGPTHAPNPSWGYSLGVNDTHVYLASGKVPWDEPAEKKP